MCNNGMIVDRNKLFELHCIVFFTNLFPMGINTLFAYFLTGQ